MSFRIRDTHEYLQDIPEMVPEKKVKESEKTKTKSKRSNSGRTEKNKIDQPHLRRAGFKVKYDPTNECDYY